MKILSFYFIPCLFILMSCSDQRSTATVPSIDSPVNSRSVSQQQPAFLDLFSQLPDGISGCGEYLTFDTTDFGDKRYVFVSDLKGFSVIRVNGKDIRLKHISSENHSDTSYSAVYRSGGQTATLSLTKSTAYDEGGFYKGTLVLAGDIINVIIKVHGESGC